MQDSLGEFTFMAPSTSSSLYRNGEVYIDRDAAGDTAAVHGLDKLSQHAMAVTNARSLAGSARMTCERNGFELQVQPLVHADIDFLDHDEVVGRYYGQCEDIVVSATGARAYAFDHNIRSASGQAEQQRIAGGQNVQGPAHVIHGDYTLRSAPDRLTQLARPPSGNDTLRGYLADGLALINDEDVLRVVNAGGRFAIINVWRSIADEPVATHPMAFCDGMTVAPDDLVVFEIRYEDRVGENYFAKHSDAHRMYYYPAMTKDEVVLIKQWDSAGTLASTAGEKGDGDEPQAPCSFSFHSAFQPQDTPDDAPDRWSIEVRCIVLYDD